MKLILEDQPKEDYDLVRAYIDAEGDLIFHPNYTPEGLNEIDNALYILSNAPQDGFSGTLQWTPNSPTNRKLFFVGDRLSIELV